uniref:(northern house mosquito) hypothetical protein n=1 Tax=Culex pipiens TaxID=7175 RepID=A0A8D7ZTJ7_CULPI
MLSSRHVQNQTRAVLIPATWSGGRGTSAASSRPATTRAWWSPGTRTVPGGTGGTSATPPSTSKRRSSSTRRCSRSATAAPGPRSCTTPSRWPTSPICTFVRSTRAYRLCI